MRSAEVFPPGEFIRKELEERGWTQIDLADILGRPVRLVNRIIAGKRGITPRTAIGLGAALGTSPQYWLELQSAYRLWKLPEGNGAVTRRASLHSRAPIKEAGMSLAAPDELSLREHGEALVSAWRRNAAKPRSPVTPTSQAWDDAITACANQLEQALHETGGKPG